MMRRQPKNPTGRAVVALLLLAAPACGPDQDTIARLDELEAENQRLQLLAAQLQAANHNRFNEPGATAGEQFGDTRQLQGAMDPESVRQNTVEQVLASANALQPTPLDDRYQRLVRPDQAAGVFRLMNHVGNLPLTNAYALRNTNWALGFDDQNDGEWASLLFGDTLAISNSSELEQAHVALADYGGSNLGCVGPNCVVLMSPAGGLVVQHYALDEEGKRLWEVECVTWAAVGRPGEEQPTDEELLANSDQLVTWRSEDAWCMHHEDAPWFDRIRREGIDPEE